MSKNKRQLSKIDITGFDSALKKGKKPINPKHRIRLKNLLKEIGINGAKLAEKTGTSYPLFLKVSGGTRNMTPEYAEHIMMTTGVDPKWLLGDWGEDDKPLSLARTSDRLVKKNGRWKSVPGVATCCTKETFAVWDAGGGQKAWASTSESDNSFHIERHSQQMIWMLAYLSNACSRSNRHRVLYYNFFKLYNLLTKTLRLRVESSYPIFLEFDPAFWKILIYNEEEKKKYLSKKRKAPFKVVECPLRPGKSNEYENTLAYNITKTFNPIFVIELSEALKGENRKLVKDQLDQAQRALDVLRSHLDPA